MAGALAEFFGQDAEMRGARIFRAIDAVAEAGNLDLLGEGILDALGGLILFEAAVLVFLATATWRVVKITMGL